MEGEATEMGEMAPATEMDETTPLQKTGKKRKSRPSPVWKYFNIVVDKETGQQRGFYDGLFACDNDTTADEHNEADISIAAAEMMEKFKKYWDEYVMVLAFAVMLDPQYKFGFVKFALIKTHGVVEGDKLAAQVYFQFNELYKEYQRAVGVIEPSNAENVRSENQTQSLYTSLEEFELYEPCDYAKTEVEKYLDESRMPSTEKNCVLSYWKLNSISFPILSCMARDILAIPITSVASESTFSMGGRILNKCRSSLSDENVNALVTTNNWLTGYDDFTQEEIYLKVPLHDSPDKENQ